MADVTTPTTPGQRPATAPAGGKASASHEFDSAKTRTQGQIVLGRFLRHRLAMTSLGVLVLLVLFAFVGPLIWTFSYEDSSSGSYLPPSGDHPLGTTEVGKDMLALLMRGTQYSIEIALVVALLATLIGVVLGALAGYLRGFVDATVMRLVDLLLILPYIAVAAIIIRTVSGSWYMVALVLAMFHWMQIARITRAETLSLAQREFVEAARACGAGTWRIIFKHLVPNMIGSITVNATLTVATAVLAEAGLSFIGLGVQLPDTSLGVIVSENYPQVVQRPWLFWGPFLVIVLISLTINFIGDGLRDAFDPRQTKVRA
ncbi:peptide/nickel transport system permease protein [Streptoalloteichus tenebrarius]|uniref:Peptide/nickel transport system permease protein n=1 Tax=Streptoalloteichus tenebrarius (strain ATCC 17920 / DSM 40477 / JCM 4838 / CBS 697.72 / NBRC 16177 / NCIMB 11028 / NRRL B-12390 / A12253. 1 / ISP 5477) TaxID=1933 RepID=A0ABT1I3D6_STRSD|nr:ABC transporter permease [Streptoalloteichus tenebrarius]MCP2262226.1 peptide/nickel transport system permease protein [Streptoalloteichus tenebrarius]BFF01090.1 ABC transporter permease [Streptoalloteichus tenebrarius]